MFIPSEREQNFEAVESTEATELTALGQSLAKSFADVIHEPLPQRLSDLLKRLSEKDVERR